MTRVYPTDIALLRFHTASTPCRRPAPEKADIRQVLSRDEKACSFNARNSRCVHREKTAPSLAR